MDIKNTGEHDGEYRSLLVDTVDNSFNTLQTLCAATSRLLFPCNNELSERFFFSDPEMCQPLMHYIDEWFVQSQSEALSAILNNHFAGIFVTLKSSSENTIPSFNANRQIRLTHSPHPNIIQFAFRPKTELLPPRLLLITKNFDNIAMPEIPRYEKNSAFTPSGWHCLNAMNMLFDIFWTDSVDDIRVEFADRPKMIKDIRVDMVKGYCRMRDTTAIRSVINDVVFGIRDFLHSKQKEMPFIPESYREELEKLVANEVFDEETAEESPSFMNSIVAGFVYNPKRTRTLYPSFITGLTQRNYKGNMVKKVASIAKKLSTFDIDKLRIEYKTSLTVMKSAAMYYEFTSAIRDLRLVEILLTLV